MPTFAVLIGTAARMRQAATPTSCNKGTDCGCSGFPRLAESEDLHALRWVRVGCPGTLYKIGAKFAPIGGSTEASLAAVASMAAENALKIRRKEPVDPATCVNFS